MIGGWTSSARSQSTGPGTLRPTPQTRSGGWPLASSSSANQRASWSRTTSGPSAITRASRCSARTVPARSTTAARACGVSRSATRTTACPVSNSSRAEGRPPVEVPLLPRSQPAAKSWSSRWPTVERERPVASCNSPRVMAAPLRISRRRWPALAWVCAISVLRPPQSWPGLSPALTRSAGRVLVTGPGRPRVPGAPVPMIHGCRRTRQTVPPVASAPSGTGPILSPCRRPPSDPRSASSPPRRTGRRRGW
ncbi:hypothetical protein GA0115252_14232 [Streptomyces sp. DfronAA-171]|nr:hypothetical protein GA0115252_14232 [Streptomyces sp. DfronAA-171]